MTRAASVQAEKVCHLCNVCGLSITEARFAIDLNRHPQAYDWRTEGLAMCLRDGIEAATWVGFSAAALLALLTPIIFLV